MNAFLLGWWQKWIRDVYKSNPPLTPELSWASPLFQHFLKYHNAWYQMWGTWANPTNDLPSLRSWRSMHESITQVQSLYRQWMEMLFQMPFEKINERLSILELKVKEHAQFIDNFLGILGQQHLPHAETMASLNKLIEQQGREFNQLTNSIGTLLKNQNHQSKDDKHT